MTTSPVGPGILEFVFIDFFFPMPPHVLVDSVVFPPGHGRRVTDL